MFAIKQIFYFTAGFSCAAKSWPLWGALINVTALQRLAWSLVDIRKAVTAHIVKAFVFGHLFFAQEN